MSDEDVVIWPRHIHAAGLCITPGARTWCKRHGIAFEDLRRGKVMATDLERIGDALGLRVAAVAREEADGRQ